MSDCENLHSGELFNRGKRFYIGGDYSKALEHLSKACRLISSEKSDTCDELFEPYLYYAKALYMFSKFSSDLIGDKVKDVIEEDNKIDDNKLDDIDETCEGSLGDSDNVKESDNIESDNEKDKDGVDETEAECKDTDDNKPECSETINDVNDVKEEENKSETDEDVGYLQMAYETIECAKLILLRQLSDGSLEKKDLELKMADCYDLTADIYVEEEVFNEAIDQYEKALELRCKNLFAHDRLIAESYYKIGMAYSVDYRCAEAKLNFERCRYVLVNNRDILFKNKESTEDLDSILSEISEKIADAEEGQREYDQSKECLKQLLEIRPGSSKGPRKDVPATDISHLVRKKETKRNSRDDTEEDKNVVPAKITKTDQ